MTFAHSIDAHTRLTHQLIRGDEPLSSLEELALEFDHQVGIGAIRPSFFYDIQHDELLAYQFLLVAREGTTITGILKYALNPYPTLCDLAQATYLSDFTSHPSEEQLRTEGFDYAESHRVVQLIGFETFPKLRGHGTRMMDALKEITHPDIMFLQPGYSAVPFYKRHGFTSTGIFSSTDMPLMIWHNVPNNRA